MVFNSITFALFFALVLALHHLPVSWRARKTNLLLASYAFYSAWSPPLVVLIWISTLVDWFAARAMHRADNPHARRFALLVSLAANLGLLGYFKYAKFLIQQFTAFAATVGIDYHAPELDILLPVGISFYTFQSLSYSIDVYRRKHAPWDSFLDFAFFVTFFPQLVAGPIVRAFDFLPQCKQARRATQSQMAWGLCLLILGLFQKTVVADSILAPVVDQVYASTTNSFTDAWLGTFAYAGQIFCDFAGYSTCAIGVAMCLGFALPDNFRFPYAAAGFSDFWRRWHISLSQWLRDYLYIPLGGNRHGELRTYLNLAATMMLGGLWHGASWTFVVWGTLHGAYLAAERFARDATAWRPPVLVQIVGTYLLVCIAWVFFRSPDFVVARAMIAAMLTGTHGWSGSAISTQDASLVLCVTVAMVGLHTFLRTTSVEAAFNRIPRPVAALALACMAWSVLMFRGDDRAFIYFQF